MVKINNLFFIFYLLITTKHVATTPDLTAYEYNNYMFAVNHVKTMLQQHVAYCHIE